MKCPKTTDCRTIFGQTNRRTG